MNMIAIRIGYATSVVLQITGLIMIYTVIISDLIVAGLLDIPSCQFLMVATVVFMLSYTEKRFCEWWDAGAPYRIKLNCRVEGLIND